MSNPIGPCAWIRAGYMVQKKKLPFKGEVAGPVLSSHPEQKHLNSVDDFTNECIFEAV